MNAYELAKAQQAYSPPTLEEIVKQQADRIAELEKDLALKTRDRDVFRDFTLAYEKRIEELEKLEQDFIRVIKQTNPNKPQTKPAPEGLIDPKSYYIGYEDGRKAPQTKPLSDEEITVLWHKAMGLATSDENLKNNISHASLFARAIEERHRIK